MTDTPTTPQPFDPLAPVPEGITVLEASAGTGKTHSLSSLAVRYVADGVALDELLLVTFTRLATGEMRERIWRRLVGAERDLRHFLDRGVRPADEVHAFLCDGDPAVVRARCDRLALAVAEFDRATICTIHQFCHLVLSGLGFTGDVERDVEFLEEDAALVEEVIADLYVRKWSVVSNDSLLPLADADRLARAALQNPASPLVPTGARRDDTTAWSLRVRFVQAVLDEVETRKRRRHLLSFNDLLLRLRRDLADPDRGAQVAERLASRFRFVVVDEFQDTDEVQWEILRRAFGDGGGRLVLIGDPKQAIYAFRGADVVAYLAAVDAADRVLTLDTNWRSDDAVLRGLDLLFAGAELGDPRIAYRPTAASPGHLGRRITGAGPAVRVRVLPGDVGERSKSGNPNQKAAERHIADDLAADVARLLGAGVTITDDDGATEELRPGHIAVLTRTNVQAEEVQAALRAAGVPAVQHGGGSVFATDAARDWFHLLRALELPSTPRRAHRAALTPFFGWSAARIAEAADTDWDAVHAALHEWAAVYRDDGVAALLDAVESAQRLSARVVGREGGVRHLTDLRHVAELLHAHALDEQLSLAGLVTWLAERIARSSTTEREEQLRRLDVDQQAVEVLTVHRAKGLEWEVVYAPYLWSQKMEDDAADEVPVFHEGTTRLVDVGGPTHRDFTAHVDQYRSELRGEDLRLAYVALTRAKHQVVTWLGDSWQSRMAPLPRLVDGCGAPPAPGATRPVPDVLGEPMRADEAMGILTPIAAANPDLLGVDLAVPTGDVWQAGPSPSDVDLAASRLDRSLALTWVRTSYSSLTAAAHDAAHDIDADLAEPGDADEPAVPVLPVAGHGAEELSLRAVASPMADLPGGARFGTFVHDVMEHTDYAAANLEAEVARAVAAAHRRHRVEADLGVLTDALVTALRTPLGPVADGAPLAGVARGDRLDELAFELPLGGGDQPVPASSMADLARLWRRTVAADDLLAPYGDRLDDPLLAAEFRGYLTGSIDLVLRVRGAADRYVVIDHKTNWLGAGGEDLTAWHHRPQAMADAMIDAHYPLQALLYSVALYRYLRWRVPGVDPAASLGGVAYLFLRGMAGPDNPVVGDMPCGVFTWHPPAELVVGASDLLAGSGVPA